MLYKPTIITPKERYNLNLFGNIHDPGVIIHYPWNKSTSHANKGEVISLAFDTATPATPPAASEEA